MIGLLVGCSEPPARSTVTATTDAGADGMLELHGDRAAAAEGARRRGRAVLDHPGLVGLPGRRLVEVRDDEHALVARADDDRSVRALERDASAAACASSSWLREADVPDAEPDHEARGDRDHRGDGRARARTRQLRRGRSGTTFCALGAGRLEDPLPQLRRRVDRRRREGELRPSCRRERRQVVLADRAAREVLLVGAASRPRRARRARRRRSARCRRRAPCLSFPGGLE